MKQVFPSICIGSENVVLNELTVGEALALAKMNASLNEQQLSCFLRYALDDDEKPYLMTVQQRYVCLLQYLSAQKENDLAVDVNVNDFMNADHSGWLDAVTVGDLHVRQLNGYEIEALELIAEGMDDWVLGAMTLQISNADMPYIQPMHDRKMAGNIIKTRFEALLKMNQESFNELYGQYLEAEGQLASLITTGFDSKGVVLFAQNSGGNGSQPSRFQCDSAFTGYTKQLFSALVNRSTETTAQFGDELI